MDEGGWVITTSVEREAAPTYQLHLSMADRISRLFWQEIRATNEEQAAHYDFFFFFSLAK